MLFSMLSAFPNLKRIVVGNGIARQMSKRQVEALNKAGIEVVLEQRKRGRKPRFTEQQRKAIMENFSMDPSSISKYGISRRAIYYWIKKQ
jgi:hypothetical protein